MASHGAAQHELPHKESLRANTEQRTRSARDEPRRGECDVSAQSDDKYEDQLFIQVQENAKHSLVQASKCLCLCSSHCGLNLSGFWAVGRTKEAT